VSCRSPSRRVLRWRFLDDVCCWIPSVARNFLLHGVFYYCFRSPSCCATAEQPPSPCLCCCRRACSTSMCTGRCCVRDLPLHGAFISSWGYLFKVWVRSGFSVVLTPCGGPPVLFRAGSARGYHSLIYESSGSFSLGGGVTSECNSSLTVTSPFSRKWSRGR